MIDATKTNKQTTAYVLHLAKQNKVAKREGQKALYHFIVIFIPSFTCVHSHLTIICVVVNCLAPSPPKIYTANQTEKNICLPAKKLPLEEIRL